MGAYYEDEGVTCRGLKFKDEDDAYDHWRQREIDAAEESKRAFFAGKEARRDGKTAGMNPCLSDHETVAGQCGTRDTEGRLIPTSHGPMTPESVVDHLTYCSYRAQRGMHGMSAESAKRLWPETGDAMEAKYLSEKAIEKASAA